LHQPTTSCQPVVDEELSEKDIQVDWAFDEDLGEIMHNHQECTDCFTWASLLYLARTDLMHTSIQHDSEHVWITSVNTLQYEEDQRF